MPTTPAVDRMSLIVMPAECFGLLGINGAGKTTTFRMITGDLEPTEGRIWVNGFEWRKQPQQAQRSLGYCLQSDALLPYLTGRETLRLYGRLRGLREDAVNIEVDQLLQELRLSHYANVRVGHYSGGKKRKLSIAVALIGGTPVVCLDEPTTGVDPISRRLVWNLLMRCRRQGRTIVLSSHSMEECEALCTRVCILTNGRMKCLGTCQHLQARFGRGYSLTLQIVPSSPPASLCPLSYSQKSSTSCAAATTSNDDYADVKRMATLEKLVRNAMHIVEQEFPEARLVDRHQGIVEYHLPTSSASDGLFLSKVFSLMESNRAALSIVNYSLSQTTLEQIFIDLAQRSLGYCLQSDALLPYLTGRETLRLYGRLRGLREDAVNIEVDQLLQELRLSHYANVRVGHYSGGKKRKLSVAVALIGGTPVVCLDEPTTWG